MKSISTDEQIRYKFRGQKNVLKNANGYIEYKMGLYRQST